MSITCRTLLLRVCLSKFAESYLRVLPLGTRNLFLGKHSKGHPIKVHHGPNTGTFSQFAYFFKANCSVNVSLSATVHLTFVVFLTDSL